MRQNSLALGAAVAFATIFGVSFMFSRSVLETVSPLQLLAFRFVLASFVLQLLKALGLIRIKLTLKTLAPLLGLSFIQPIAYFLAETIGISLTSASEAGLMISLIPIATLLFARFMLKEIPSLYQVGAIILSVLGVFLIGFMQATEGLSANFFGLMVLLLAVIAGALYSVLSRKLSLSYSPESITFVMMHVGAFVFLPASLIQAVQKEALASFLLPLLTPSVVIGIVYLGALSSCLAFFLMNFALGSLTAAQVSVFASLTTVIAIAAGVFFLGEVLLWYHAVGGLLILAGVWGANYFQPRGETTRDVVA